MQLESILEDQLSEFERESVDAHIASCEECQARLDEMLLDDSVSLWRRALKTREAVSPSASSLDTVRRLRPSMDPSISDAFASSAIKAPPMQLYSALPSWIGDYEIHEEVGRGGMSVVYRATQRILGRSVAIKRLNTSGLSVEDLTRFYREAKAIARVQHQNIVQVFEVGSDAECPYLALEYVAGGNLATFLKGSPIDAAAAAIFLEKVARAIHHAHTHGIVHRDLKPANILLDNTGAKRSKSLSDYEPKVADFGLARVPESTLALTKPDVLAGTPAYLAPELIRESIPSPAPTVDVYALGVILYEMMIGRPPLLGPNALATIRLVDTTEPMPPRRLQPQLPRDLETICLKCLSKDPGRRYASALALADDLRRFQEGRPIEARRIGRLASARMWCRRNPLAASLSFISLAILIAGMTGIVWQWRSAVAARKDLQKSLKTEAAQRRQTELNLYAAAIAQSALFWENGDVEQARSTLASASPTPGREDFRGWEWHYLNDLFRSELHVIPCRHWGHAIARIPGSPEEFAVGIGVPRMNAFDTPSPSDGFAANLSLRDDKPAFIGGPAFPSGVVAVAVSRDGKTIAWGSATGQVVIVDAATKKQKVTLGRPIDLSSVAFVDEDRQIVVGSKQGKANFYDVVTGDHKKELGVWADAPCILAVDPQGSTIAFVGGKNRIPIYDLDSNSPIAQLPIGPEPATAIAFDPSGKMIATGNENGTLVLWNRETKSEVVRITAHSGPIYSIAYSPKGKDFATAGSDRTIRIWNRDSGKARYAYRGHNSTVRSLTYSEDGSILISGSQDNTFRVWDNRHDPRGLRLLFNDHLNAIAVGNSSEKMIVRAAHTRGGVKSWNLSPLEEVSIPSVGRPSYPVRYQTFLHNGDWIAGIPRDDSNRVAIWDAVTGAERYRSPSGTGTVMTLAADSSQRNLIWVTKRTDSGTDIHFWNPGTDDAPTTFLLPAASVRAVAMDNTGRWIAAVTRHPTDRALYSVWMMTTDGSSPPEEIGSAKGSLGGLAFNPNGTELAYASDGGIDLFNITRRECKRAFGNIDSSTDIAWSPDGSRLACVGYNGIVTIAQPESGKVLFQLRGLAPDRPNEAASNARVVFSTDGRTLISTNWDGSINVWNVPAKAQSLLNN